MARTAYVPPGRLDDWRARPDAERIAYTIGRSWDSDYRVTVYASRLAMLAFCKSGSAHHALLKTAVHPNMVVNRNTQVADPSVSLPLDFS